MKKTEAMTAAFLNVTILSLLQSQKYEKHHLPPGTSQGRDRLSEKKRIIIKYDVNLLNYQKASRLTTHGTQPEPNKTVRCVPCVGASCLHHDLYRHSRQQILLPSEPGRKTFSI